MNNSEIAQTVAGWTQAEAAAGKMCPKTAGEIAIELAEGRGTVLLNDGGKPVAYCRYLVWKDGLVEVGGTVVDPDPEIGARRKGAGTRANLETIARAHQDHPKAQIIGLTENDQSRAMVETKIGGRLIAKTDLDPIVWELCSKPGQECVHFLAGKFPDQCPCTPFDFTHLVNGKK